MKLQNKVAIVTGGAQGIGKAICQRFVKEGARVGMFDLNGQMIEKTVQELKNLQGNVLGIKVDVSSFSEVKEAVNKVIDIFGRIDILVNNAGITCDRLLVRMKEEEWDSVIRVNLKSAFNLIKIVSSFMLKRKYGRIINISSIIGLRGNEGQANYASSKAGLIALSKSAAREFGRRGITVNAVAPGFIQTSMTENLPEKTRDALVSKIPLRRIGKSEEVASLVTFLASDEAGYITGEVIRIDGGLGM